MKGKHRGGTVGSIPVLQSRIEQIPGVLRTWVEWIIDEDDENRVLVVEVDVRVHPRAMGLDDEPIPKIKGIYADWVTKEQGTASREAEKYFLGIFKVRPPQEPTARLVAQIRIVPRGYP